MNGKYYYRRFMGHYNVYQDDGNGGGIKICHFMDEEDARKEVYRLNGWKYKTKKEQKNE